MKNGGTEKRVTGSRSVGLEVLRANGSALLALLFRLQPLSFLLGLLLRNLNLQNYKTDEKMKRIRENVEAGKKKEKRRCLCLARFFLGGFLGRLLLFLRLNQINKYIF